MPTLIDIFPLIIDHRKKVHGKDAFGTAKAQVSYMSR